MTRMEQYEQLSFTDAEYNNKGKVMRREKFLNQQGHLLP
jgi:IS5 family transposase